MVLLALLLSALAMPVAAAICFGLSMVGQRIGHRFRLDRVSARDERWLADQRMDKPGNKG